MTRPNYSEAETQAILARALEIDAQAPDGLAPEQLKSVALELGISPMALEKAIGERAALAVSGSGQESLPRAVGVQHRVRRRLPREVVAVAVAAVVAILALMTTVMFRRAVPRDIQAVPAAESPAGARNAPQPGTASTPATPREAPPAKAANPKTGR